MPRALPTQHLSSKAPGGVIPEWEQGALFTVLDEGFPSPGQK